MSAVVALIILAVGVFAVFTTAANIPTHIPANATGGHTNTAGTTLQNATYYGVMNTTKIANQVFNIIGVVLIIAAIMSIVGLVYSYIAPRPPMMP